MIRGRYGLVIVGIVVAMLSVAAGAGLFMAFIPLPDPSVANRHDLLRWLVLRDLSKESAEIRGKILDRLDTEFEKIGDLDVSIEKLEDSHRQMLWHNVTVLLQPWLLSKAEQFSHLRGSEKASYIDHFLDRAYGLLGHYGILSPTEVWTKVATACQKKDGAQASKSGGSVSKLMMDQIKQASDLAKPEQQREIGEFVAAVQARWLWRQMPSFNFFNKSAKTPQAN